MFWLVFGILFFVVLFFLWGLNLSVANFFTSDGEYLYSYIFDWRYRNRFTDKKTFDFKNRTFFVKPTKFYFIQTPFPWFFTYRHYTYVLESPHPVVMSNYNVEVKFDSKDFNKILKSDVLEKLNNFRTSGLGGLFSGRNLLILGVLIFLIIFFANGNSPSDLLHFFTGGASDVPASDVVQNVSSPSAPHGIKLIDGVPNG